jgi:hypothetical protein
MSRGTLDHIFGWFVSRSLLGTNWMEPSIVADNFTETILHIWHFGYIKEHKQTEILTWFYSKNVVRKTPHGRAELTRSGGCQTFL